MLFSELAIYFDKLERTSSRLALIDILAELFSKIDEAEEIERVCYLAQGRVAPFFAPIEIGMADKTVASALSEAYGADRDYVLKLYSKLGDMGLVALNLKSHPSADGSNLKTTSKNSKLTVKNVFGIMLDIAKTKGEGTVGKKVGLLADILKRADVLSAKYLARIPLGNLRLGIGDPTILDGLALGKFGDKSERKLLEGAYNRTSDLGLIGKTLWSNKDKGRAIAAIEKLDVIVGKPIRSELCERLPNPEKVIEKMIEVDAQFKYDGFRTQIHKNGEVISIFSRNLENMTAMFPELIEGTRAQVKADTVILDSEAMAYNPESEEFLAFQETTKRRRKYNIEALAKRLPLKAFVFDILYKNGEPLLDKPLSERLAILKETIERDDVLIPAKNQTISDPKKLGLLLEDAISKGLEGLVVKKLNSKYEAGGRNFNWVKLKRHSAGELTDTIDCVVLGYIYGKGKRTAFGAGALLVGVYDKEQDEFVTVSKIGTGLTDEEWRSIKEKTYGMELTHKPSRVNSMIVPSVWVKPEIVIEVLADEITRSPVHTAGKIDQKSSVSRRIKNQKSEHFSDLNTIKSDEQTDAGYALRFPRLVSFRDRDKKAEDATTVAELIGMYEQQGKK